MPKFKNSNSENAGLFKFAQKTFLDFTDDPEVIKTIFCNYDSDYRYLDEEEDKEEWEAVVVDKEKLLKAISDDITHKLRIRTFTDLAELVENYELWAEALKQFDDEISSDWILTDILHGTASFEINIKASKMFPECYK